MNPEQSQRQCAACGEEEALLTYAVNAIRRLCTDCLLKEHRSLFCPVCLDVYVTPPEESIICLNCPSITHLACSPPPSSSSSFTCPLCSDPNFSFFPSKSQQDGENGASAETILGKESAKALVAAANISAGLMKKAAAELKKEADEKMFEAKEAKKRAKEALGNLQELVVKQKALENPNPNKRKNSDRC